MTKHCLASTLLLSTLIALPAGCGDSSDDTDSGTSETSDSSDDSSGDADAGDGDSSSSSSSSGDGDSGDGDGDSSTGDGDGDSGDGDATSGDGDGDSTTGDGDGDSGDGDTGSGCQAWRIVYNLDGSEFEISDTPFNGAGDKVTTLQAPYDNSDNIGPGELTLLLTDDGGAPGDGTIFLVDYAVTMNFQTGSDGLALVTQDLEITTDDECGSAVGAVSGADATWTPNVLADYTTTGELTCEGTFCGQFGAPPAGSPTPVDQSTDIDPFSGFAFTNDFSNFTAPTFETSSDDSATTEMTLSGTEVSRELVDVAACFCG